MLVNSNIVWSPLRLRQCSVHDRSGGELSRLLGMFSITPDTLIRSTGVDSVDSVDSVDNSHSALAGLATVTLAVPATRDPKR